MRPLLVLICLITLLSAVNYGFSKYNEKAEELVNSQGDMHPCPVCNKASFRLRKNIYKCVVCDTEFMRLK